MYKTTSEAMDYIDRVASHSTKEHRTGRIDMIPAWAREPEEYYNLMRDRWSSVAEQLLKCENELAQINAKLKIRLSLKDYEFTVERQRAERQKYNSLKESVAEYRAIARAASEHSVCSVFMELARKQLDAKEFSDLLNNAKDILGRPLIPIPKGSSGCSEEERARLRRSEKNTKKRHNYYKKRYGDAVVALRHAESQTKGSAKAIDDALRDGKPLAQISRRST